MSRTNVSPGNLRESLRWDVDPKEPVNFGFVGISPRMKNIPEWTRNDLAVRKLLMQTFPKMESNAVQRSYAARWARIIQLYFRLQWHRRLVAAEMGMTACAVNSMVRNIRRASAGLRADGSRINGEIVKRGAKPRGRPKKIEKETAHLDQSKALNG